MTRSRRTVNPRAPAQRATLRAIGMLMVIAGGVLTAIGLIDFFGAMGGHSGPPQQFWCAMVGLPILAIGFGLLRLGYLGAIGRYVAGETAPVATDTINYVGEEAAPGIRSVVHAVADGLRDDPAGSREPCTCPACGAAVDADARFCDQCGGDLATVRTCPACEAENATDARFCDRCGHRLAP